MHDSVELSGATSLPVKSGGLNVEVFFIRFLAKQHHFIVLFLWMDSPKARGMSVA